MSRNAEAFWAKVEKLGSGCWLWQGWTNVKGYGEVGRKGCAHLAHRFAFELERGPIPHGLNVHHECNNPRCVNPDHLTLMSRNEHASLHNLTNHWRKRVKHCKRGHEFTPENTFMAGGQRRCRICSNKWCRESRQRAVERGRATLSAEQLVVSPESSVATK